MKQAGGGAVVIIASISGWKPAPRPQYGAAKAAEIYLAMELGRELASEGIRVNAVSPGSILFPGGGWESLRERDPERFAGFIEQDFPFGRLGTPEEVADVVTFLLSERASWISGTQIRVDGAQGRATDSAW
jgi:3-oxoacyl-[acyl-carrier protein] reductase